MSILKDRDIFSDPKRGEFVSMGKDEENENRSQPIERSQRDEASRELSQGDRRSSESDEDDVHVRTDFERTIPIPLKYTY